MLRRSNFHEIKLHILMLNPFRSQEIHCIRCCLAFVQQGPR